MECRRLFKAKKGPKIGPIFSKIENFKCFNGLFERFDPKSQKISKYYTLVFYPIGPQKMGPL